MIKANELRIGNLLMDNLGIVRRVSSITETLFSLDGSEWFPSMAKPIPLTPEILEKAGFECEVWFKIKEAKFYENIEMQKIVPHNQYQLYGIAHYQDNTCYFAEFHKEVLISRTFKYLHELQNIYFALTGEELQINL